LNWNRIVPGTIRSVLRSEPPVIRPDDHFVRDYFYVEDGAAAYMLLAERLHQRPELTGQAFNFSIENEVSMLDLVNRILRAMGSDLKPVVLNEASNEIRCQFLSAAHARKTLDWTPVFTLDEGLARTIAWYEAFLGCGVAELAI
jgi:CDP-glucose 4,6-dehydratase